MFMTVIPFFSNDMAVDSYMFLSQKATNQMTMTQSAFALDDVTRPPSLEFIDRVGLSALTNNLPIFIPIKAISLLVDIENQLKADPKMVVFLIEGNMPTDAAFVQRIQQLRGRGFKFALKNIVNYAKYTQILPFIDFLLVSDNPTNLHNARMYLLTNYPNIHLIVTNVETIERYDELVTNKFEMFEGAFYRIPVTRGEVEIAPLKMNYMQLLNIANDENFDITEVSAVVQQDIALAMSLLKMVNNLNLSSEITSISHAAAILGQQELRKWITTAVVNLLCSDKPNDLIRLSLLRAKFCEKLAPFFEMAIGAQELFLTGLFSVLDIALQVPMKVALENINLPRTINDSLLSSRGKYAGVLEFTKIYEQANWQEISRLSIIHQMDTSKVAKVHHESMEWYGDLLSSLYD